MAVATQPAPEPLTPDEYLHTAFHPDCDFVDGHLEERNMGSTKHALLQMQLGFWFISHRNEWKIRVLSELRTRVSENRVRLPDVCVVFEDGGLQEDVRTLPPSRFSRPKTA